MNKLVAFLRLLFLPITFGLLGLFAGFFVLSAFVTKFLFKFLDGFCSFIRFSYAANPPTLLGFLDSFLMGIIDLVSVKKEHRNY